MSYLVLLPCMFAAYYRAQQHDLSGGYFATVTLLLTVILSSASILTPGVDTLVATCVSMVLINCASWYVEREFTRAIEDGTVQMPVQRPVTRFCSLSNHDFAVSSQEFNDVVSLINTRDWSRLTTTLEALSAEKRQGMYASIDYSAVSPVAALEFLNLCPENIDANVFYGHVKLCEAKRLGLVPGELPGEEAAASLASAFKHFRIAQRLKPDDVESLCGLIITKGCIALKDEQIEASLRELLAIDALHLHGLMSAARFLITSTEKANRFVALVDEHSQNEITTAMAKLVAHIECNGFGKDAAVNSSVIADLYSQLRIYLGHAADLGQWQQAICSNIFAFAFKQVGDVDEAEKRLSGLEGKSSPYPWLLSGWPTGQLATVPF